MSSPEEQNPLHVKAVEDLGVGQTIENAGETIFRNMLAETKLFAGPGPTSGGWCMVEMNQDGKKIPTAVLVLTQNNAVFSAWYDVESMEAFAQSTMVTLQMLQQAAMASMPLIVANADQMQQAVQAKNEMDGKFGSKQNIDWPPKDWKN